ncbi:MAG: HDOD domain-containing protein [Planctomycetaceae bacterium]
MIAASTPQWSTLLENLRPELPEIEPKVAARLPVIPQVMQRFSELTSDPNVPVSSVARLIASDGTLTSMLLKFANSATVGAPGQVKSVQHAITLLGLRRLKTAVLSLSFQQAFNSAKSRLLCMKQFSIENSERAAFSRCVARCLGCDTDLVPLASMLQDVLLPVLTEIWHTEYAQPRSELESVVEFERKVFGWDHAVMAAALMARWNFPAELIVSVARHHDFDAAFAAYDTSENDDADDNAVQDESAEETSIESTRPELLAVAAASLLPEQFNQSTAAAARLIRLQECCPACNLLEIASHVDEYLRDENDSAKRTELYPRLSSILSAGLVEERFASMLIERNIGRYTLEEEIGKGGMGVVYKARHAMLLRPAAIKLLDTRRLDDAAVHRFETEVQLTSQLTSPHTITIYDYGMTPEGFFFYAMEYVDGLTLSQLVHQCGPLPEGYVMRFLLQACDSLAEAHALNLIHRDIKPDNMMLRRNSIAGDTIKVLDFGLAAMIDEVGSAELTSKGFCGTPMYMAPEAIESPGLVDQRIDIYALGAVGHFLLTGQRLFHDCDGKISTVFQRQLTEMPVRPSERVRTGISPEFEDVIMACLQKPRDQRPQTVIELAERIRECSLATPSLPPLNLAQGRPPSTRASGKPERMLTLSSTEFAAT